MSMLAFVPGLTLPCLFAIVWAEVEYANDQYVLRDYYTDVLGRSCTTSFSRTLWRIRGTIQSTNF
jgi:hypothetical protein